MSSKKKKQWRGGSKRTDLACHASREVHFAVSWLVSLHVQHHSGSELVGGRLARVLDLNHMD